MHSVLRSSFFVACLSLPWIPAAHSAASGQRWVARNINMQNMVVDLGMDKFTGSGSECKLQDFSNEPLLSFSNVQQNQTYIAAALSFVVDTPITANTSESGATEPAEVLQESSRLPIYLSYLQTSMHKRTTASTILSSEVDPLVSFKLPEISSCGQSIVFIAFVFVQPHPLLVEDCYTKEFSEMKDDFTKREDYDFGGFWKSAALGDILAATWVTIGSDKAGCLNGEAQKDETNTEGEGVQIISVTTDIEGEPTTFSSSVPISPSPSGATAEGAIEGIDQTITITTTITADGKLTVITPTAFSASSLVGSKDAAFVGGRVGQQSLACNAENNDEKSSGCDSITKTTTTTTATSTVTKAENSAPQIIGSASQEPESYITSLKTITLTTTDAQGSPTTEVITTTVISTVLNLQAPGGGTAGAVQPNHDSLVDDEDGFVNGTSFSLALQSPSLSSSPFQSSTTLLLASTTAIPNNNNVTGLTTSTTSTSTDPGKGKISALPSISSSSQPSPVQAAGSDTQPGVMILSAFLLGGLGVSYFAFL